MHAGPRAREGLVHGGDLQNACCTYYPVVYELLDCAPSLDSYVAEVESALAFARRTGNDHAAEMFAAYRRLVGVLRGEPADAPPRQRSGRASRRATRWRRRSRT